jgi:uncharacterized protein (DUF924 family)
VHEEVIRFWFEEIDESQWWTKDAAFDDLIAKRFSAVHARARNCELFDWRSVPQGRLAEVIVLDQFSRNLYRGKPESFACDPLALALAQEAVSVGADRLVPAKQRMFFYMPFMHSESLAIHDVAKELFTKNGERKTIDFEREHRKIIERFGRYPHRNEILGRQSTPAEIEFLKGPNSGF